MTKPRPVKARRMSLRALVGALFFMVSGGPYGIEEIARTVGFGGAIVVLVVTPLLWSLPTALMVGELSAALPEEGGYYAWVRRALGPFWGYQEAWLSLAASVFDMALYPTLFVLYLERLWPSLGASPVAAGALVIAASAVCNLAGAEAVGEGSAALTALLLAPFGVLAAIAFFAHPDPAAVAGTRPSGTFDLAGGVLVAMWNYMGWDNASTVAGEVENPQRTYPRAVLIAVALVALTYVVPVAAMWKAHADPTSWDAGAWVDAGRIYGGRALGIAIVLGGMVSAFGMCTALCLSYSRLPAAMALDGYLPRIFSRRLAKNGVPWVSVIACSLSWTFTLGLSFDRLLSLDILLYGASLALEFAALIALRLREPELNRPMRIPGGVASLTVLGAAPLALVGFALVKSESEQIARVNALAFGSVVILLGPIAYALTRLSLQRRERRR